MRSPFSTRARPGQMLKREREKLVRLVRQYVLDNGGQLRSEDDCLPPYRLELPTLAGLLRLALDGGTGFGRFDDEKAAAYVLCLVGINTARLNPHSGKWNWHFGRQTAREAFEAFVRELEPLVRPKVGYLEVRPGEQGLNVVAPNAFGEGGAGLLIA